MANTKSQFGVIEGTLVYVKVAQPDNAYQSTEKEWSVEVIVDEDTADKWDEEFKKQPAKKIKASEFESKYKIPVPEHLKGEKNVYGIKLKRKATNDGVPVDEHFRPKVYIDNSDGERVEVGLSRLCANGSYGKVSYYISDNAYGRFSRLQNLLFSEDGFKEYVAAGGGNVAGGEFGEAKPVKVEPARKEATEARKPRAERQPEPDFDGEADLAPF